MSRGGDRSSAHAGPDAAFTRRVLRAWVLVVLASVFSLIALTAIVELWSPVRSGSGRIIGPADFAARGLPEDRPAPSFSLPMLGSAGRLRLASYAGQVVVLNLWARGVHPVGGRPPSSNRFGVATRQVVSSSSASITATLDRGRTSSGERSASRSPVGSIRRGLWPCPMGRSASRPLS